MRKGGGKFEVEYLCGWKRPLGVGFFGRAKTEGGQSGGRNREGNTSKGKGEMKRRGGLGYSQEGGKKKKTSGKGAWKKGGGTMEGTGSNMAKELKSKKGEDEKDRLGEKCFLGKVGAKTEVKGQLTGVKHVRTGRGPGKKGKK